MNIQDAIQKYLGQKQPKHQRKTIALQPQVVAEIINTFGRNIIGEGFVIDEENKAVYQELCDWFMFNQRYEVGIKDGDAQVKYYTITHQEDGRSVKKSYEKSLYKGVLLMGNTGTGKTDTLRIFTDFAKFTGAGVALREVNCKKIGEMFSIDGYEHLQRYYKPLAWFFDDLGEEDIAKHYANQENVMAAIITQRYNLWKQQGVLTFATTNLNGDMLLEMYGERVFERICEMFNITVMAGRSRRYKQLVK